MAPNNKEMENFVEKKVQKTPGIRRTQLKNVIRKEFEIGHASALSIIDRLVGKNIIKEEFHPPNWKRYYPNQQ